MDKVIKNICAVIRSKPLDITAYEDLFTLLCESVKTEPKETHRLNGWLRDCITRQMPKAKDVEPFFSLYKRSLLLDAPDIFDAFMLYIEINRDPAKRFYQPRRAVLKQVVDALQALSEDELDELFLSMPPRVGKSTLMIFFVAWLMGRDPEHPNLYSSYTDIITKAFYNGVLEVMTDKDTYLYGEVFPESQIVRTNAADETIDIKRRKHYPTLTCRSIDGTINGACDAQDGVIISDDLVSGIEEALSKDRLMSKWTKVDNNLIPRGKGKTKYLWIGTRWSMIDPAGIRMDVLTNDEKYKGYRFKVINLPALNENDESNFNYPYGVGFDTLYYQRRRASFERNNDTASWLAQYMGEPIEREGTLFEPDDMRYFNGVLPDGVPDRVFMAIDPAFGGGDFTSSPVCVQYGEDIYVPDVVFNNGEKGITQPLIANTAQKNGVRELRFEATKMTESYKDGVDAILKKDGYKATLTSKAAPTNKAKEIRIFSAAPDIRERFIFLESGHRSKEYEMFMQNVYSFKVTGKNKHDDAPDSLAMAVDMITYNKKQGFRSFVRTF